jgi:hypothetical protein
MTELFDYQDGNALAGSFAELFAADISSAEATCRSCGQRGRVAQLRLYRGPGLVARCPSCDEAILRFVRTPTAAHFDLRGAASLVVPMASES